MSGKIQLMHVWIFIGWLASPLSAEELILTSEENSYLQEHPIISMCVDPDWLPYEKLDAQGRHIGLVAEYISLLQSKIGVSIKAVNAANWEETQTLYRVGMCDIVSALNKNDERSRYLAFTQPFITSPAVLVLNEYDSQDKELSDLDGKTLAMVKGYVYEARLRRDYPNIKITYVPNMEIALQKVSAGQIDASLGPLFLAFALMQELGLDNLKVVGDTKYQDELRIGIQKDNKVLADIFNKAVASLTTNDHTAARRAWASKKNH